MRRIRIAVCEDEPRLCEQLTDWLHQAFTRRGQAVSIDPFTRPEEVLRASQQEPYDVFFLDIDMPGLNGIELAAALREMPCVKNSQVVFVSGKEEFVFDTFAVRPLRFVRKSRFQQEAAETVDAVLAALAIQTDTIQVSRMHTILTLRVQDILYAESFGHSVTVHTRQEEISASTRMGSLEEELLPHGFLRIHKSYLVNARVIYSIEAGEVILEDGTHLPLSRSKAQEVREQFLALMGGVVR